MSSVSLNEPFSKIMLFCIVLLLGMFGWDHKVSPAGHYGQFSSCNTPSAREKPSLCGNGVYVFLHWWAARNFTQASVKPFTSCYSTAGLPTLTVPLAFLKRHAVLYRPLLLSCWGGQDEVKQLKYSSLYLNFDNVYRWTEAYLICPAAMHSSIFK